MEKIPLCESTTPATAADWQKVHTQASDGNAEAQFTLAVSYSSGQGLPQDLPQAVKWYRLAADQQHTLAQLNLGLMLIAGEGGPADNTAALHWIGQAAEAGDAGAQFHLGNHCHRASFNPHATNQGELRMESYKWFSLSAAQGYGESALHCDRVTINMSRKEVTEARERVEQHCSTQTSADVRV